MKLYKKKKLLKQNYLFHRNLQFQNLLKQNYLFLRNLQFQKFIKTSPSVLPGPNSYAPQPTSFPNHHTVVGETPHSTH